jgi:hypothetical protein
MSARSAVARARHSGVDGAQHEGGGLQARHVDAERRGQLLVPVERAQRHARHRALDRQREPEGDEHDDGDDEEVRPLADDLETRHRERWDADHSRGSLREAAPADENRVDDDGERHRGERQVEAA